MREFKVYKDVKLIKFLTKEYESLPFVTLNKLLRQKDIKVNGKRIKEDVQLFSGDIVAVYHDENKLPVKIEVVFEDENILIVNKKKGINSDDLFAHLSKKQTLFYIHRLDRNTSGLIVFAKNEEGKKELLKGFKDRRFEKFYYAIVFGRMKEKEGTLEDFLVKDSDNSLVKIFDKPVGGSSKIITKYKVLETSLDCSLLQVELVTGKTHQIRAHLAYYGNFVLGDGKYGNDKINKQHGAKYQQLQAFKLTFKFESKSCLFYLNEKTFEIKKDFTF